MVGSKKGDVSTSTLIYIVLGALVLGLLVFGFTTGWGNFWETITGGSSTSKDNTVEMINYCNTACNVGKFNTEKKNLKVYIEGAGLMTGTFTCKEMLGKLYYNTTSKAIVTSEGTEGKENIEINTLKIEPC